MDKATKLIRIGFIAPTSEAWMGGMNYFKNLFFAINATQEKDVEIFIFIGKQVSKQTKEMLSTYGNIIEDSIFDRKSIKWISNEILQRFFSSGIMLEKTLKSYKIDILSHSFITNLKYPKTICWIPDFQHIHLPDMFSKKDIRYRNKSFLSLIENSDKVILSSNDALQDFRKFSPKHEHKTVVLQFVSQPEKKYSTFTNYDKEALLLKYQIPDTFYFIPNQFWKHKNHQIILESAKMLKDEDVSARFVFSGHMKDPRHKDYISELYNYIDANNIKDNIFFLGIIDYQDVFKLIKFSKAVINPSLFEGWSSTVEECKSVGKNLILSDISVHKEQCPDAIFFDRYSAISLKNVLANYSKINITSDKETNLQERTNLFGQKYLNTIKELHFG